MRKLAIGSLLVLAVACSAQAMTIDGLINDWESWYQFADPDDRPTNVVEVTGVGAKIEGGYFYTYLQITDETIEWWHGASTSGTSFKRIIHSTYIDVDNSTSTESSDDGSPMTGKWTDGSMNGADILYEYGREGAAYLSHSLWGAGSPINMGTNGPQVTGWNTAWQPKDATNWPQQAAAGWESTIYGDAQDGYVLERCISISQLEAYMATLGITASHVYKVGIGSQVSDPGGAKSWGYDLTNTFLVMKNPGDWDGDATVEGSEMDALFAQYGNTSVPTALLMYDTDHSGTVGIGDLDMILTTLGTWRGDANLDGQVDSTDALALGGSWQGAGGWANGDSNGDGFIDSTDALALGANWQAGVGPGVVPEPATLSVLALAGLALLRRRR